MDLYIFELVCKEIKIRYDEGLPLLPVSINFSRQDFDYIDVIEEINRIYDKYDISQYGIDKSYFIIEITEQGLAKATDKFYEQLAKIRENGYKLWVDDFGSGYSSLDLLQEIHFDLIKFDMRFMRQFDRKPESRVILTELMRMAASLNVETVAEGVDLSLGRGIVVVHQSHTGPGKALLPLGFGRLLTVAAGKEQERAQ